MSLKRLFVLLISKNKRITLAVIITSVATIMSSVGLLSLSAFIISYCALHPSIADIMVPVVGVRFFGIARGGFRYIERLISHNTNFKLLSNLRSWLYGKIEATEMSNYMLLDKEDIFTRLVDDIETLQEFYLRTFNPFVVATLIGIIGFFLLAVLEKSIGVTFIIMYMITIVLIPLIIWKITKGMNKTMILKNANMKVILFDLISGMADILANSALKPFRKTIEVEFNKLYKIQNTLAIWRSFSNNIVAFLSNITMVFCIIAATFFVKNNSLKGVYVAVIALGVISLFEAAPQITLIFQRLEQSNTAAGRIFQTADNCEVNIENTENRECIKTFKEIQLENINFRYPNQSFFTLKNISFKLSEGKKLAIVGASGSGKTTLTYILLKWLKSESGSLKLSGIPEEIFSVVNQQVYLFNTSIKNNLLIANSEATKEEIQTAFDIAGLKEFINGLPQGYETELGENGMKLSGGQRQRIGIARAIIKKSNYLILDEVSAGMDMLLEKQFMEALFDKVNQKGIIMVTHRLVAMDSFDEILVLEKGSIVERGTHEELLKKESVYHKMYRLQQQYLSQ